MNKITYDSLKKEFDNKVEFLQKQCPHKKTDWFDEYFAIGHSTGKQIRVCLRCNKELEKK